MPKLSREKMLTVSAIFLGALALVVDSVYRYNTVPSGYVAVYPVIGMWLMTLFVTISAAILIAIPRTRFAGFVFAVAIVFIPCTFFLGVKLSEIAGLNRWRNAPMVRLGPDAPASVVIYYQMGASRLQTDDFEQTYLYSSRGDMKGIELKPGIRSFLRLLPSQAHGHSGVAIDFYPSIQEQQRSELIESISNSPLVFQTYRDISPAQVPNPDAVQIRRN
jgi:hypothetical protein